MPALRELVDNVWIVEVPKFSDEVVKVIGDVGELENEWVGARATPAIPEFVKLGTDVGGVSMMAFDEIASGESWHNTSRMTHRGSWSQPP